MTSCDKYIVYAANKIKLDDKCRIEYTDTWLHEHRVMVMEKDFLRFNFPMLPRLLITILFKILKSHVNIDSIRTRSQSVNGFMFEAQFFENCKKGLIVSSCSVDSGRNNNATTLSFAVSHITQPVGCLAQMRKNELYELRVLHPVIDGVGLLTETTTGEDWLVFIQVSLSRYTRHCSKLHNIFNEDFTDCTSFTESSLTSKKDHKQMLYLYMCRLKKSQALRLCSRN